MLQGISSEESKVEKKNVCYDVVFRRRRVGVEEVAQWLGVECWLFLHRPQVPLSAPMLGGSQQSITPAL